MWESDATKCTREFISVAISWAAHMPVTEEPGMATADDFARHIPSAVLHPFMSHKLHASQYVYSLLQAHLWLSHCSHMSDLAERFSKTILQHSRALLFCWSAVVQNGLNQLVAVIFPSLLKLGAFLSVDHYSRSRGKSFAFEGQRLGWNHAS